jgi:serine 3-dehydrogenase
LVETEFTIVRTGGDRQASDKLYSGISPMTAEDIADTIWWIADLPPHVNINTIELMPTSQSFAGFAVARQAIQPRGNPGTRSWIASLRSQ